jgi:hypothetical protein
VSAAGTTMLMLHFVERLRAFASEQPGDQAPAGLRWPWLALALASFLVPWGLYLYLPGGAVGDVLKPSALWAALLPVAAGVAAAGVLRRSSGRLPRVPEGDIAVFMDAAVKRGIAAGPLVERANAAMLGWPLAGMLLLVSSLAFGLALLGGRT